MQHIQTLQLKKKIIIIIIQKIWDRTYNTTVISIVESSVQWCNLVLHFVTNIIIWTKLSEVSTWKFSDSYKCKLFPWCIQQRPETLTFQILLPCYLSFTFTDPFTFTHTITHEGQWHEKAHGFSFQHDHTLSSLLHYHIKYCQTSL